MLGQDCRGPAAAGRRGRVRRAAQIEQRLAMAEEDLATLSPDAADEEYKRVEQAMAVAGQLPVVGEPLMADLRQEHAMVAYWRGDYTGVPSTEADLMSERHQARHGVPGGQRRVPQRGSARRMGPGRARQGSRRASPPHLHHPAQEESRVRRRLVQLRVRRAAAERGREGEAGRGRPKGAMANRDQPPPPSVHGDQGSPPADMPSDQFNVIVPLRPEERAGTDEGGHRRPEAADKADVRSFLNVQTLQFAEPLWLWLLIVPAVLLVVWIRQFARRRRDARVLTRSRLVPVRERFPFFRRTPRSRCA
jgi:hypothetical protein